MQHLSGAKMLSNHAVPDVAVLDIVVSIGGAIAFIAIMSLVREPARQKINATIVAGAGAAYLAGGLGVWELAYLACAAPVAYMGLSSYRFIALGWAMHTFWDLVHHFFANPIWPFMLASSAGCAITDSILVLWLLFEAPSIWDIACRRRRLGVSTDSAISTRAPCDH
jgi:hypothetical protein